MEEFQNIPPLLQVKSCKQNGNIIVETMPKFLLKTQAYAGNGTTDFCCCYFVYY